jgi:hypothetical protein
MLMPTSTSQTNSRSSRLPFSILSVLSTLFWAVAAALAADQPLAPLPYAASYEARAMGMRTSAYRTLELADNNRFRLNHGLSVTALGANLITVNESTEFVWQAQGAVPLQYHYQQSGVRRRDEQVAFDWQQLSAAMNRDGREQTQTLESGMQDNLSFSAQMSADLLNQPDLRTTDTLLTYQILDARRLEHHEYRVAGEERISTAAGESFTTWNEASSLLVNGVLEDFPVTNAFVEMVENLSRLIDGEDGWIVSSADSIRVAQILDTIAATTL